MGVRLTMRLGARPTPQLVRGVLRGLVEASYEQMRCRPLPALYASGVRYQREPGREEWQTAEETYGRKHGDCEDLTAYRCAELWIAGERGARPHCYAPRPGLIHCVVRRADGTLEDPSKRLGMKGKG
jgi:hypothetical protein